MLYKQADEAGSLSLQSKLVRKPEYQGGAGLAHGSVKRDVHVQPIQGWPILQGDFPQALSLHF